MIDNVLENMLKQLDEAISIIGNVNEEIVQK